MWLRQSVSCTPTCGSSTWCLPSSLTDGRGLHLSKMERFFVFLKHWYFASTKKCYTLLCWGRDEVRRSHVRRAVPDALVSEMGLLVALMDRNTALQDSGVAAWRKGWCCRPRCAAQPSWKPVLGQNGAFF